MSDTDTIPRARFYTTGTLPNTTLSVANATDATGHQSVSAFAISIDLGDIVETNGSVVWAFGMVRDPAVTYVAEDGSQQQRSPYWRSQFETSQEAVSPGRSPVPCTRSSHISFASDFCPPPGLPERSQPMGEHK